MLNANTLLLHPNIHTEVVSSSLNNCDDTSKVILLHSHISSFCPTKLAARQVKPGPWPDV